MLNTQASHDSEACGLCDSTPPTSSLQQVMTMNLINSLHECATTLNDGKLLAKLSSADTIAQELKYHCKCFTALYNRETNHLRSLEKSSCQSEVKLNVYPLVLSELGNKMVETSLNSKYSAIFPLADIISFVHIMFGAARN